MGHRYVVGISGVMLDDFVPVTIRVKRFYSVPVVRMVVSRSSTSTMENRSGTPFAV